LSNVALSPSKVCAELPMLVMVRLTTQNCPCAVVPKYSPPISVKLQSIPCTTKLKSPSAAGCPMPGAAGSGAASATASSAGAALSTAVGASAASAVPVSWVFSPSLVAELMTPRTKMTATTRNHVFFQIGVFSGTHCGGGPYGCPGIGP
jgi:hypothetical protein